MIPHPDDESEAWSLIEQSRHNYPIFILLTRGESTGYCEPSGRSALQAHLGEIPPSPYPYTGRWTPGCEGARVESFHRFLDDMAGIDPTLSRPRYLGRHTENRNTATGAAPTRKDLTGDTRVRVSRDYEVWADERSARVVFDLGDGDLTDAEVTWAIQTVRRNRGRFFPHLREYAVIGASYYNASYSSCKKYLHGDHRAVHRALWATDQGVPGPQWASTCGGDPDVAATGGRTNKISDATHQHMFGVRPGPIDPARNPGAFRTGFMQRRYGWLAPTYWQSDDAEPWAFSPTQSFWRRF